MGSMRDTAAPKRRYLLLPPELVDGSNSTPIDMEGPLAWNIIGDALREFVNEGKVGEEVALRIVELSDAEVVGLPGI